MISFPIVVPVKTFGLAKQRLSGILEPSERAALARSMLIDVLHIVASATLPSNVIVVTSSPEASDIAKSAGMRVLHEAACSDLNSAIDAASRHMIVQNAGGFLMLPADVPEVTIAAIHQAFAALEQSRSLVLAPAISDGGTNLLACRPPQGIRPEFGTMSFARHLAAGERAGLACHPISRSAHPYIDRSAAAKLRTRLGTRLGTRPGTRPGGCRAMRAARPRHGV